MVEIDALIATKQRTIVSLKRSIEVTEIQICALDVPRNASDRGDDDPHQ